MAYDPKDTGTPIPTSVLEASNKSTRAAQPATNTDVGFKPAQATTSTDPGFKPTPSTSGSYVGNINNADTGLYKPSKGNPQAAQIKKDFVDGAYGGAQQSVTGDKASPYSIAGAFNGENQKSLAKGLMEYANDPNTSRLGSLAANTAAWPPYLATKAVDTAKNLYNYATESRANPAPSINSFAAPATLKSNEVLATNDPAEQKKIVNRVEEEKFKAAQGMPRGFQTIAEEGITPKFETQGLVPSTSQQVQSAKSEAPKADGSQQPVIDAMTPQQAMQAGGLTGRPSDALRPIIHQAMLANPKSQDAINAYDQFNKIADHLDKQYTPVDPKTGQRYEVTGDMRWKDGTPVQQGLGSSQDLGPEVAALDRASGFNQPGGAPAERQINPKYANGIGASMYNFGPNADTAANTAGRLAPNQLPSDYYLDQARGPAKALYSDVGSSGQHIPGQIVKYDEQGNRAPSLVERSGRSPDQIAEMKQQSDYAKSPEGMQQAHMKQLQDDYKHASFMSGNDTREGLMWTARAHNLQEQMADENKTMAGERVERYKADADSDKTTSLAAIAARKEASEMDKENAKQARENREYDFKVTKAASDNLDSKVKTYFPDEKMRERAFTWFANGMKSGQLNNEMLMDDRVVIPLIQQMVQEGKIKEAGSNNWFSRSLNPNAPVNFGQGEAFGKYTNETPAETEKRLYSGE